MLMRCVSETATELATKQNNLTMIILIFAVVGICSFVLSYLSSRC